MHFRRAVLASLVWIAAAALTTSAAGCGGAQNGVHMTDQEIATQGTITFDAPTDTVFTASRDALRVLGYSIAAERPERGILITGPKTVLETADVSGTASSATAVRKTIAKQYTLSIKDAGGGKTRVVATPSAFINGNDVSATPVWLLEGSGNQREEWHLLFAKIKSLL